MMDRIGGVAGRFKTFLNSCFPVHRQTSESWLDMGRNAGVALRVVHIIGVTAMYSQVFCYEHTARLLATLSCMRCWG
jgi:hypothetical protein